MSLPHLALEDQYTGSFHTGIGYTNFKDLLLDLHQGVLELGKGCEVLTHDEPLRSTMGFDLCVTKDGVYRWWEFYVEKDNIPNGIKALTPYLQKTMRGLSGRVKIARLMEDGNHPDLLESLLKEVV